ncbi:phage tail domain-containing protein [Clostridium sp. YIM B02551]|uniref:phage distal tail protein n=1 Tax=Clostridium sp. YIM B02551 TaxID=2910679 RepID=UPI001EEA8DC1|nr:phage tail domain-containing protein [Clostridium sp. YIM B02551]
MLLDNTDIKNFGAIMMNKSIQPATIESLYAWLPKSLLPSFLNQKFSFVTIETQLYFKGINEEDIKSKVSSLISKSKDCIINFGDNFYYKAFLIGSNCENTLRKETKKLTLNFISYCYKSEIIEAVNRIASKTINVPGNLDTPAIVEITPSISLVDLVVTGLGETFTIKNLTTGQKVIISGEDCTVLQNGVNKFGDYDSWDFPKLQPGSNTITFSKSSCDISIKYKPRWI